MLLLAQSGAIHIAAKHTLNALSAGTTPAKAGSSGQPEDPEPSSQPRPGGSVAEKNLIGKRIKVFWPAEKDWFCGRLGAVNSKGCHLVEYDDGDKEWIDLATERYELLSDTGMQLPLLSQPEGLHWSQEDTA